MQSILPRTTPIYSLAVIFEDWVEQSKFTCYNTWARLKQSKFGWLFHGKIIIWFWSLKKMCHFHPLLDWNIMWVKRFQKQMKKSFHFGSRTYLKALASSVMTLFPIMHMHSASLSLRYLESYSLPEIHYSNLIQNYRYQPLIRLSLIDAQDFKRGFQV